MVAWFVLCPYRQWPSLISCTLDTPGVVFPDHQVNGLRYEDVVGLLLPPRTAVHLAVENQGRLLATAGCALERIQRIFDRVPYLDAIEEALLVRLASINDEVAAADKPSLDSYDFSRMLSDEPVCIARRLEAGEQSQNKYLPAHPARDTQFIQQ